MISRPVPAGRKFTKCFGLGTVDCNEFKILEKKVSSEALRTDSAKRLVFDNFVPCKLKVLVARMLLLLDKTHESLGISGPEFSIMVILAEHESVATRDINKTTSTDKATITRALDRLSHKGLISRGKSKTDSRLNEVRLTDKGLRMFDQIERSALAWESQFLRNVSITELNNLLKVVAKLEHNLDTLE